GFTPQLLAGVWVGADDRFIRIENSSFYGGTAARPIWQAFFKKIYADKSLGIDKNAQFVRPADLQNEINNADMMRIIDETIPSDEGNTVGADDYTLDTSHNIPGESQAPVDDNAPKKDKDTKKDTVKKAPKIGEMNPTDEKKEKKGFFKKLFGGKDKKKDEEQKNGNDY
ncbi:MAG TPA: penicillin-binding protein, partial [Flavisolibacter sp.]|nr:penicillin-binding protein [Flavisolibacter sp.]